MTINKFGTPSKIQDMPIFGTPAKPIDPIDPIEATPGVPAEMPIFGTPSKVQDVPPEEQTVESTDTQEKPFFEKVGQGISRGLSEAWAPTSVTKEEMTKDKDAVEITSEILTSMGADIAGNTAATTLGGTLGTLFMGPGPGTAVGAAAGMVGYSLYSSIGQELLAKERTGEFSFIRAAGRFLLNINPVARMGGKLAKAFDLVPEASKLAPLAKAGLKALEAGEKTGAKVARVAGQVAGEAAVAGSEYGANVGTIAGATSLVLHGLGFARGATPTVAASKLHGIAADPTDLPEELMIGKAVADKMTKLKEAGELSYSPEKMTPILAKSVLNDKTNAANIEARAIRHMSTKTKAEQDALFADAMTIEVGDEVAKELGPKLRAWNAANNKGRTDNLDPLGSTEAKVLAGSTVTRQIDSGTGIGATKALNNVAERAGKFEQIKTELELANVKALKKAKEAKITPEQMTKIKLYMGTKDPKWRTGIEHLVAEDGSVAGKVKAAVDADIQTWDAARASVKGEEIEMGYIENYVPLKQIDKRGMADQLNDYLITTDVLRGKLGKPHASMWTKEDLTSLGGLGEQAAQDFLDNTKYIASLSDKYFQKVDLSPAGLSHLRTKILGADDHYVNNEISAAYTRSGDLDIPMSFREMNNQQLLINYINTNLRSAVMAPALREAQKQEAILRKLGMNESALWWSKVIQDVSGGSRESMARSIQDTQQSMKHQINKAWERDGKVMNEALGAGVAKFGMEFAGSMQSTLYPALFALNFRAMAKGLVQPLTQSAPEMGGTYGYHRAFKAMLTSPFKHFKRLKEDGVLGSGQISESIDPELGPVSRKIKHLGQKMMKFYQATDTLSRLWTYSMGQAMADDLAQGNKMAIDALRKMGPAVRTELATAGINSLEAFKANQDKVGDIIGKYMIGKTQFHYGKAHQAQFIRDAGPLFSMFTTWPTAIASDVYTILKKENPKKLDKIYRFMERYGAQWAALTYIGMNRDEDDKVLSYLDLGPSWASGPSPLDMSLLNHPVIKVLSSTPGFVKALLEMKDPNKELKSMIKQGIKLSPAGIILNEADRIKKVTKGSTVSGDMTDWLMDEDN